MSVVTKTALDEVGQAKVGEVIPTTPDGHPIYPLGFSAGFGTQADYRYVVLSPEQLRRLNNARGPLSVTAFMARLFEMFLDGKIEVNFSQEANDG